MDNETHLSFDTITDVCSCLLNCVVCKFKLFTNWRVPIHDMVAKYSAIHSDINISEDCIRGYLNISLLNRVYFSSVRFESIFNPSPNSPCICHTSSSP